MAMIPFKPSEVFAVNDALDIEVITLGDGDIALVVDNFYKHPMQVRDYCLRCPAPIWKHTDPDKSSKNFKEYWDCRHQWSFFDEPPFYSRLSEIIEQKYGIEVNRDFARTSFVTNLFQWIIDQPEHSVGNVAHFDSIKMMAANIYLNTDDEVNGGTAVYRYRLNGSIRVFGEDFEHLQANKEQYAHLIEDGRSYYDLKWRDYWDVARVFEMKFNRMVMYPGYIFHGAYHTNNAFKYYPRLTQTAFIATQSVPNAANYFRTR